MARAWIDDRWKGKDGKPTARHGKGSRWQVFWWAEEPGPGGTLTRRRRTKAFTRKVDAQNYAEKVGTTSRDGTYRDPDAGQITFGAMWDTWLAGRVDLKGATLARYRRDARTYVLPQWGHRRVGTITREEVAAWVADLAAGRAPAEYVKRGTGESTRQTQRGPLSANSIKHLTTLTSAVLEWAVDTGRVGSNAAHKVKRPRAEQQEMVFLAHREVEALATAAEGITGARMDRALVLFLAYSGVRIGEATALRVADVDLAARRAHIRQTWTIDADSNRVLDTPKNHERRSVPLTRAVLDTVGPLLEGQPADAFVFRATRGGAVNDGNWRTRVFVYAASDADLAGRGVTPHKLRHTAASSAIAAGADVQVVRTMLGHRDASMTLDVYGHLWPDRLDEVANAMDAARDRELARATARQTATERHDSQMTATRESGGHEEGRQPVLTLVSGLSRSG